MLSLPIRRPVATSMVFLGLVILGVIGWLRLPVELVPALGGDALYVQFYRPGSEPEVVERELLLPLEARVSELESVAESWGEITGSGGTLQVEFEPGTDLGIRELELQQLATELARSQPLGTFLNVSSQDLAAMSRFVMVVQIAGGEDQNTLRDLIDERVLPKLAAVSGVSRVLASGGASREITVRLDPDLCAAEGVTPNQAASAVARAVRRLRFLGGAEGHGGRTSVMLDGRPAGIVSLGETRIDPLRSVLLRHVAEISQGPGREETAFRVNGKPAVGVVIFQEEGANLVRLGRSLRQRLTEVESELNAYGLDVVVGFDAAETVEEQLGRLKRLALTGFAVALVVLFLFLRRLRAVAVVAVSVPVSLLGAVALLYLGGLSLNLITLFGLAVGVGMLVDNSIVVYEAIEHQLARGADPGPAAIEGVRRTVRAILAASATNAVVFLPVAFATEEPMVRGMLQLLAVAILLPLAASILVAVGLVPLLARWLAAPAAADRMERERRRRERWAGLVRPDRWRDLFSGVLATGLRRPAGWLAAVGGAVVVTVVVALPWVVVTTAAQEAAEADEVRLSVDVSASGSLEATGEIFTRLETSAMDMPGVETVESVYQEEGGTLTVRLVDADQRPLDVSAARVRRILDKAVEDIDGAELRRLDGSGMQQGGRRGGGTADLFGEGPAEVIISGPDAGRLGRLAESIQERLESIPEVASAWTSSRPGRDELQVRPDETTLAGVGLTPDQVLPALAVVRREGVEIQVGFTLADGREIPVVVRSDEEKVSNAVHEISQLRLATAAGVQPLGALASVRIMPPPPTIEHHNGRREAGVYYRLGAEAPRTGPSRHSLEDRIRASVREVYRPEGYSVETEQEDESLSWFRRVLGPVLFLLFAVLAITFESLTMPVLILVAVPLTLLGATWALVLSGTPADLMALVGAVALLGLTVNPAILLVDRMQRRVLDGGWTAGAAALAAVRERARPVLMTSCTTVAGLWPLALTTGREMEIWPPFATVVMGGLVTSTLLTLLVIPMGFVLLERLDRIFGRLGPWVVLAWLSATAVVVTPLIMTDRVTSFTWQALTIVLVAGLFLGAAVLILRRDRRPEPEAEEGLPPVLEVRFLRKVYGRPGPIGRALRSGQDFAERVLARGGDPVDRGEAGQQAITGAVVLVGVLYLAVAVNSMWWTLVASLIAAVIGGRILRDFRCFRGMHDAQGRVLSGGLESRLAAACPWTALAVLGWWFTLVPWLSEEKGRLAPIALVIVALIVALVQLGRHTARSLAEGRIGPRPSPGLLMRPRTLWRSFSRTVFGLDLPRDEVEAVATIDFRVERGMVGLLGPNGAGKTTVLRLLAGILEPSLGVMNLGGVPLHKIRRHLARWVGYLPQEFGLPEDLTAREYLEYYALLYGVGKEGKRCRRVEDLLEEVGLGDRADEKIGAYSGGMRQRVAVARTLLRLPPVIIVDEPTVGLDPRERIRFRNLLARLSRGRVVLFSTHVVEDVAVACERVLVMKKGRVVFDGEPARLADEAQDRVWLVRLPVSEEESVEARVIDRVPEADGSARLRLLATEQPHPLAERAEPTLEDGYLLLVGEG
ncbi:MAG: efflux RND transporter permease subunit [Thermoanaerobaculales bacterium]|nr:efflux RND transporter permease subunit [Thermoanaerobaculales bacterium]